MHPHVYHTTLDTAQWGRLRTFPARQPARHAVLSLLFLLCACGNPKAQERTATPGEGSGKSATKGERQTVWIGATGDLMPGRGSAALLLKPEGEKEVFGSLLAHMKEQDLLVANLETAVTERGTPWPKTYRFRVSPAVLEPLKRAGIDLVTLTNNHVFDYTEEGFLDTIDSLKIVGLPSVGAGRSFEEAARPWSGEIRGEAIRVWSLGAFPVERTGFSGPLHAAVQRGKPGILWADERSLESLEKEFAELDRDAPGTFKMVCVHAGTEYSSGASAVQAELYRKLIELGADLVVGTHPHVLQGIEWYRAPEAESETAHKPPHEGLIVWSLGNYLFDGMDGIPFADEGLLLSIGVSGGKVSALRLWGAKLEGPRIVGDGGEIARRVLGMSRGIENLVSEGTGKGETHE